MVWVVDRIPLKVRDPHTPKTHRKSFGRKIYKALLAISFTLAVNYSLLAVYINSIIVSDAPDAPYALGLSVVWRGLVFLNVLPIVLQEAWQCRTQGVGPYIRDVWNVVDIVMLCLVFASLSVSFVLPKGHRYFYILSGRCGAAHKAPGGADVRPYAGLS